jgi:uncharacterized membrane protein
MKKITATKLDIHSIVGTSLGYFAPWLAAVLLITWSGYPGVVCITPMAWLLAIPIGMVCSLRSKTQKFSTRLLESTLAGGILGLLQGLLFFIIIPVMGPIKPEEEANQMTLNLIMLTAGALIAAVLSLFSAFSTERRKKRDNDIRINESIMRDHGL